MCIRVRVHVCMVGAFLQFPTDDDTAHHPPNWSRTLGSVLEALCLLTIVLSPTDSNCLHHRREWKNGSDGGAMVERVVERRW